MDCFCVRTLQGTGVEIDTPVGIRAGPVVLVGRLVPANVSVRTDSDEDMPSFKASGEAKGWAVATVQIAEWFVDVSENLDRPSVLWVLGGGAWYRLLKPSKAYAGVHASFMDRVIMGDQVCDMIKKQPLTTVHEMIGKFVVGNLSKETQAARALTLLERAEFLSGSVDRASQLNQRVDKAGFTSFFLGTAIALRSRNVLVSTGQDATDVSLLEVSEALMHYVSKVEQQELHQERQGQSTQSILPAYMVAQAKASREKAQRIVEKEARQLAAKAVKLAEASRVKKEKPAPKRKPTNPLPEAQAGPAEPGSATADQGVVSAGSEGNVGNRGHGSEAVNVGSVVSQQTSTALPPMLDEIRTLVVRQVMEEVVRQSEKVGYWKEGAPVCEGMPPDDSDACFVVTDFVLKFGPTCFPPNSVLINDGVTPPLVAAAVAKQVPCVLLSWIHIELLGLLRRGREEAILSEATWPEILRREIVRSVRERGKAVIVETEELSSGELPRDRFFTMRANANVPGGDAQSDEAELAVKRMGEEAGKLRRQLPGGCYEGLRVVVVPAGEGPEAACLGTLLAREGGGGVRYETLTAAELEFAREGGGEGTPLIDVVGGRGDPKERVWVLETFECLGMWEETRMGLNPDDAGDSSSLVWDSYKGDLSLADHLGKHGYGSMNEEDRWKSLRWLCDQVRPPFPAAPKPLSVGP